MTPIESLTKKKSIPKVCKCHKPQTSKVIITVGPNYVRFEVMAMSYQGGKRTGIDQFRK